jgi:thiamine biosynthesis lipoprotein
VVVEARLFDLLQLADRLHRETWGAFDVTTGPLIRTWGFFKRQGRMPAPTERERALRCVGMRHVELNAEHRSVRFRREGVEINLGSIGKGYALDRVAEQLRDANCRSFLLHAGGSSVFAAGAQPDQPKGWPITLRHPWLDRRPLGTVHLRDRALGTSAATHQHFEHKNQKLGHVIDPRTGRPAQGIASATALASSAAEADALATAFYVLGIEKTRLYCQSHPGIAAVLLPDCTDAMPVTIGLTPAEFTPADSQSPARGVRT